VGNAYTPPTGGCAGQNDVWTIFELNMADADPAHDTITPIGVITQGVSSGSVQSLKDVLQRRGSEDPTLFQNLPAKE
jgi:hypothetical protein